MSKKEELKESENRLLQREASIDKRDELYQKREAALDEREEKLSERQVEIQNEKSKVEEIKKEQLSLLEKISGFSKVIVAQNTDCYSSISSPPKFGR